MNNRYRDLNQQTLPKAITPFVDDVKRFSEKVHKEVLHNILRRKLIFPEAGFMHIYLY